MTEIIKGIEGLKVLDRNPPNREDPNFDPRRPKIRSRLTAISSREVGTIIREPRLRVTKAHTTVGLRQAHLARMRCQSRDLVAIFVKIYITIELH